MSLQATNKRSRSSAEVLHNAAHKNCIASWGRRGVKNLKKRNFGRTLNVNDPEKNKRFERKTNETTALASDFPCFSVNVLRKASVFRSTFAFASHRVTNSVQQGYRVQTQLYVRTAPNRFAIVEFLIALEVGHNRASPCPPRRLQ